MDAGEDLEVFCDASKYLRHIDDGIPEDAETSSSIVVKSRGEELARFKKLEDARVNLESEDRAKPGKWSTRMVVSAKKRYLRINVGFGGSITSMTYHDKPVAIELDPPPGSSAERRKKAMEDSAFKRWLYPILGGLGKGGFAIVVLVIGPLVSNFLKWLFGFLPDIDVNISRPDINLPEIPLPDINFPAINLPPAPDWVIFLLDYTKVWVPLVLGLIFAIGAVRTHRKSEKYKKQYPVSRRQKD